LFGLAVLAVYRHRKHGGRALWIAVAAASCLLAAMVGNYHLQLSLGGMGTSSSAVLPVALWILACTPLLWATEQFAGIDRNIPMLATGYNRLGIFLLALGLAALYVPVSYLDNLQWAGLLVLSGVALVSVFSLLFDPRHWRWATILVWLAMLPGLGMIVMWMVQLPPGGRLARRGFEFLLFFQLALYLFLPWIRLQLQNRARLRRMVVATEDSAEQKVAQARELMLSSIQASLENASGGDLEWIAYRRLLGGLKPVLPQQAAAVAAMNYHNEDLLLVEPKSAEPRFRTLLDQRGALLKSLSRSKAPQQITIDFDGPEGPLETVRLAVIPLPIEKPGWGVLLIEREEDVVYSDQELGLGAEFAALATTAGDEADRLRKARISTEIDLESGVYRRDVLDQVLTKLQDAAFRQGKLLSILHIGIDNPEKISPEKMPVIARTLADLIREEVDYGETIGRLMPDQFMVLAPGRAIGVARELAERICAEVRKENLGGELTLSIGVSQMMPGERSAQFMRVRAINALGKARLYGGNQVQAVASTQA
jgi:GGDEF domain-containing protein